MQSIKNQLKQLNKIFFLLILTIVIIITIFNVKNNCETKEGWFVYKDQHFGSYQSGYTDEKGFYVRPEYRKPYRWPVGFKSEHPVKHISSLNPWA
tara:strand:+ start:1046 stop:1330 length:285 start_codon:yes stop_codon:yes gene_type:complete